MTYKFTNRAKKAIEIANDLAIELGHNYIGTEHILYGLSKEGSGVAAKVFTALANKKINVKMIDQGSSELNIIVGVKNIHFNDAIRAIYNTFIEQE